MCRDKTWMLRSTGCIRNRYWPLQVTETGLKPILVQSQAHPFHLYHLSLIYVHYHDTVVSNNGLRCSGKAFELLEVKKNRS